jgi:NhaA family Na+:H+ antiporter
MEKPTTTSIPPGAWQPAFTLVQRGIKRPLARFMRIEAASGVVLLLASVVALVWANSSFADVYEGLLHFQLGVNAGDLKFERSVHFWINDGLMTIFFFVAGLEIRREIHEGELSEWRRASLPLAAALGGMLVPAAIFAAFNATRAAHAGWGIPMATDIAFAIGVLALLGKRVPPALRVLLLALAVIDDIGGILVIAFFYSSDFSALGLAVAALGIFVIWLLQKLGERSPVTYILPALVVWGGMYSSGIHPTIAGVVVGLMTPATPSEGESSSPLEFLLHALHRQVAFGIMPLFALANAGVALGGANFEGDHLYAALGVGLGLVVGKPVGIVAATWIAVKLGASTLPRGVHWLGILVVGLVAGIGFTVALFIGELAFVGSDYLGVVKLSILVASVLSGVVGLAVGRVLLSEPAPEDGVAATVDEAERSTDA